MRRLASTCLTVRLSGWNHSAPTGRIFMKCHIWVFCEKSVEKVKDSSKYYMNNGYFTWRPINISDHVSLNPYNEKRFRQAICTSAVIQRHTPASPNEWATRTVGNGQCQRCYWPAGLSVSPTVLFALMHAQTWKQILYKRPRSLTLRRLMSYIYIYIYIYGAPILDVSRSHTTTQHSR